MAERNIKCPRAAPSRSKRLARRMALPCAAAVLVLGLSGCGGGSNPGRPAIAAVDPADDALAGVVFIDRDGDGVPGADDQAVGAEIRVRTGVARIGGADNSTTSNRDGSFTLSRPEQVTEQLYIEVDLNVPPPTPAGSPASVQFISPVADPGEALAIAVPAITACSDPCPGLQQPDLTPLLVAPAGAPPTSPGPADSLEIDTTTQEGRTLLRFASIVANIGPGPLHVIAEPAPLENAKQQVWQRTYALDGRYSDSLTGGMVFHEGHEHFHLDRFEEYRLVEPDGGEVVAAHKVSFCLTDSLPVDPDARPNTLAVFTPPMECGAQSQSINSGWTDHYDASLPDQWIDVTGLADGSYVLELEVDPDSIIEELDETNNVQRLPLSLIDGTVIALPTD